MSEEKPSKSELADSLASMRTVSDAVPPEASSSDQVPSAPAARGGEVRRRSERDRHAAIERDVRTRRTLIPVLLTLGVMLPAVGSLKWLTAAESPFAQWPTALVALLMAAGVILLLFAVINMWQVKSMLHRQRPRHGV